MKTRRCTCLLVLRFFALAGLVLGFDGSGAAQPSETAVKASFLPRFARYVAWPAGVQPRGGAPFQLCVIGLDPFGRMLDDAASRERIDGHRVTVRRVGSVDRALGCHVAFVEGPAAQETSRMLLALRGQPALTVTDGRAGAARGMIHFTVVDGRVRFFIDEASAAERGLSISSRLLAIAAGVRPRRS
ncbi:MAG TPA: YfiR family protein [Allosphingosinicella sp.]|nr:YfiR family protein [Allosphingosinicella sp.]